jgi:hypothetical protein
LLPLCEAVCFALQELHENLAAPDRTQIHNIQRLIRVPAKAWSVWAWVIPLLALSGHWPLHRRCPLSGYGDLFYTNSRQERCNPNAWRQSGWYHDKAAQCNRMALISTNAVTRNRLIGDRDNWKDIAARIDAAEEALKKEQQKISPSELGFHPFYGTVI